MKTLYLITGDCHPKTGAEMRLDFADDAEAEGDFHKALEYRAIVARWRKQYRKMGPATPGGNPDALVPPLGTPEHPLFWHEPRRDDTLVCRCGHLSTRLCDEPLGRGKTCDAGLCDCCATRIGDDLDHCGFHARTKPRDSVTP